MPDPSVALDLLQSPYVKCIEPPQVAFYHVLGDLISESDEFFLIQVLCDFVVHVQVAQDFSSSAPSNSMYILQREFNSLVVWDLYTSNTNTLDTQTLNLGRVRESERDAS